MVDERVLELQLNALRTRLLHFNVMTALSAATCRLDEAELLVLCIAVFDLSRIL
jgi:hypothetical protein